MPATSSKVIIFQGNLKRMQTLFANLFVEAAVVGVVCVVFLILMVVAGVKQILEDRDE